MIQKPTVRIRLKKKYSDKSVLNNSDNARRINIKYLKKLEERVLPKGCFNVFEKDWLV